MYVSQAVRILESYLGREPARRAGEEEKTDEEDGSGDGLNTPWNTESCRALGGVLDTAVDEARAVLDEVLNQNTPSLNTVSLSHSYYTQGLLRTIAHCWRETTRPRISLGAISAW